MDEKDIQVLIDGTVHYFHRVVDRATEVGTPYLADHAEPVISDYTGVIHITGARRGSIYFTAPAAMLSHILLKQGEPDRSPELMADIVGEVANTISGNARRSFGQEFLISVPSVYQGMAVRAKLALAERAFVVPITWKQYKAALVVSLT
jgi:chemotaxis protein CheX